MNHPHSPALERPSTSSRIGTALFVLALLPLVGCSSKSPVATGNAGPAGSLHTGGDLPGAGILVEENFAGNAGTLRFRQDVAAVVWGRLVDVTDVEGTLRHRDFVVGEDIVGDGVDYEVTQNPATSQTTVQILHEFGSPAYVDALWRAEENLIPVASKGLGPGELPPFSSIPRNGALVLRFEDILDARYVDGAWRDSSNQLLVSQTTGQLKSGVVKVQTGNPPNMPYEARIIVGPNHGDVYEGAFHPTRVIVDMTVSETQAAGSNPPLGVNSLGLPESVTTLQANVVVRIPTKLEPQVGQNVVLTNRSLKPMSFSGNGANDPTSLTNDVVRAMRSGNSDDVNNGFLLDNEPPALIGSITVDLSNDPPSSQPFEDLGDGLFLIPKLQFVTAACITALKLDDDVIDQGGTRAIVRAAQQEGPIAFNVIVEVIAPLGGTLNAGQAQVQTAFDPVADNPACFVRFSPNPVSPPSGGVSKHAQVLLRFSEPMDPAKLGAFDAMTLTRKDVEDPTLSNFDYVVGRVQPSADLREFSFVPVLPLDTSSPNYHFALSTGGTGPTDLAGNPLDLGVLKVLFSLDPSEPPSTNGGFVFRFKAFNEFVFESLGETEEDGWGELRSAQILFDVINGRIRPRPVSRFSVAADRDKPVPSIMTAFTQGIQTPLSNLGSKMQTLWRYVDVGFSLTDEGNTNLDVEGLAWAPFGGGVVSDSFPEFSIRLSHTPWLPDEALNPSTGFPLYPQSGLAKQWADNFHDQGKIVHPREKGYTVSPSNMFIAESGTFMQPWPLNRNLPPDQFEYYTWRDTALLGKGGAQGAGAPLDIEILILGLNPVKTYTALAGAGSGVPSVGLPLMMEFRCYPASGALGLNGFDISLASNTSARPNFRAFATGYNQNGENFLVNPDTTPSEAAGGFNPVTGGFTQGVDNSFYIGQMDLVTRVSRTHSIWFDTGFANPKYSLPVIEPPLANQPSGTQMVFAYRGATLVNAPSGSSIRTDASTLDFYGNPVMAGAGTPTFLNNDSSWQSTTTAIDNAKFLQFRITFISNAATNLTPSLSSLGFAYSQ